jgi:LDH2 family malate/lactate/ureidoglycolate dehydrogenase
MRIAPDELKNLVRDVFVRSGMSEAHAALVADVLVWAELRGMDTHGVMRVPRYVDLIRKGELNARPSIKVLLEAPACVHLDCDRAAGPVAMMEGVRAACGKAKAAGIGLALARATTHTAALGYYAQSAARDGFAAIAFAASVPLMAYHGARAAGLGTAPLAIAVPGEDEPFALDMASSMISMGSLMQARAAGAAIPEGAALAADGSPTTDARRASIPLPLGGAKGSGLAFMVECLASLLGGNPILAEALGGSARHQQNGVVIQVNDDPLAPISAYGRQRIEAEGDRKRTSGPNIRIPLNRQLILRPGESVEVSQTINIGPIEASMLGTPQVIADQMKTESDKWAKLVPETNLVTE